MESVFYHPSPYFAFQEKFQPQWIPNLLIHLSDENVFVVLAAKGIGS